MGLGVATGSTFRRLWFVALALVAVVASILLAGTASPASGPTGSGFVDLSGSQVRELDVAGHGPVGDNSDGAAVVYMSAEISVLVSEPSAGFVCLHVEDSSLLEPHTGTACTSETDALSQGIGLRIARSESGEITAHEYYLLPSGLAFQSSGSPLVRMEGSQVNLWRVDAPENWTDRPLTLEHEGPSDEKRFSLAVLPPVG